MAEFMAATWHRQVPLRLGAGWLAGWLAALPKRTWGTTNRISQNRALVQRRPAASWAALGSGTGRLREVILPPVPDSA